MDENIVQETPNRRMIGGILSKTDITYTSTVMTIEYSINSIACLLIIAAMLGAIFLFSMIFGDSWVPFALVFPSLIALWLILQRSYRYVLDKERKEVHCKWDGFWGTPIGKGKATYSLKDASSITIHQILRRGQDSFKIKLTFRGIWKELELPSEHTLSSNMEYANFYRDFLELQTPVQTTISFF